MWYLSTQAEQSLSPTNLFNLWRPFCTNIVELQNASLIGDICAMKMYLAKLIRNGTKRY